MGAAPFGSCLCKIWAAVRAKHRKILPNAKVLAVPAANVSQDRRCRQALQKGFHLQRGYQAEKSSLHSTITKRK